MGVRTVGLNEILNTRVLYSVYPKLVEKYSFLNFLTHFKNEKNIVLRPGSSTSSLKSGVILGLVMLVSFSHKLNRLKYDNEVRFII